MCLFLCVYLVPYRSCFDNYLTFTVSKTLFWVESIHPIINITSYHNYNVMAYYKHHLQIFSVRN